MDEAMVNRGLSGERSFVKWSGNLVFQVELSLVNPAGDPFVGSCSAFLVDGSVLEQVLDPELTGLKFAGVASCF
jgi:hypothetical protein